MALEQETICDAQFLFFYLFYWSSKLRFLNGTEAKQIGYFCVE